MPSRREFIQAGLAASLVPVALPVGASASVAAERDVTAASSHRPFRVVCDARCRYGAGLARETERLGLAIARTDGDITDFWFHELAPVWKEAPVAVAGLTAHGPLFCLERFGWDHGLRVVFRGVHRLLDTGHVEHALTGPSRTIAAARSLLAGDDWPVHVARLLSSCPMAQDSTSTTVRSALAGIPDVGIGDTLFSWVIAAKPSIERRF